MGTVGEIPPELEPLRRFLEVFVSSGLVSMRVGGEQFAVRVQRRAAGGRGERAGELSRNGAAAALPEIESLSDLATGPAREIVAADLVGIVRFSRPAPLAGDRLESDRELAYVEALGIRNPVRSRGSGTIVEIFVEDGAVVDYGRPLFAIARV
jgi:biotin carboxyl carrier protein